MSDIPTDLLSGLDDHLGYWLRHVSNHVSGAFAQKLQARNLSVAEWVALRHLYDKPDLSPGDLAEMLGMTRGGVSKIVDKLESKGLIVRVTKLEDHRGQLLSLTPVGRDLIPELVEIADRNDEIYFGCLDIDEQAQLRKLLQKLVQVHQWDDVPVD